MNAGHFDDHPSIGFYDGDYPPTHLEVMPENRDEALAYQGLAHDTARYLEIARDHAGPVLELGCGTGRVSIPLARVGSRVTAVDGSGPMLERLRAHLAREDAATRERLRPVQADMRGLESAERFGVVVLAFNTLLCLPDLADQRQVLARVRGLLRDDGVVALDVVNPLALALDAQPPGLFFPRCHPDSGRRYYRFAGRGPLEADQTQRLYGWYDELDDAGAVRRTPYEMRWRPMFRFELELALESAGLAIRSIEGGHRREPITARSPRFFVVAGPR